MRTHLHNSRLRIEMPQMQRNRRAFYVLSAASYSNSSLSHVACVADTDDAFTNRIGVACQLCSFRIVRNTYRPSPVVGRYIQRCATSRHKVYDCHERQCVCACMILLCCGPLVLWLYCQHVYLNSVHSLALTRKHRSVHTPPSARRTNTHTCTHRRHTQAI